MMMPASSHLITQTIRQPNNLNLMQYSRNSSVYPYSQISYKVKLRNSKNCVKFNTTFCEYVHDIYMV